MNQRHLRDAFGRFATGVTVVTCATADGGRHGATVNAFTAVSLEPALCQVTLTRRSKACRYLRDTPFAVNILAADQADTAWHFAGRPVRPEPEWSDGPLGPVLTGAAATISCRPWRTYDGGDHLIVIGEVADADITDREPLLFHAGTFRHLGPRDAAAHWGACLDSPESGWFTGAPAFTAMPTPRRTAPAAPHPGGPARHAS